MGKILVVIESGLDSNAIREPRVAILPSSPEEIIQFMARHFKAVPDEGYHNEDPPQHFKVRGTPPRSLEIVEVPCMVSPDEVIRSFSERKEVSGKEPLNLGSSR